MVLYRRRLKHHCQERIAEEPVGIGNPDEYFEAFADRA